MLEDHELLRRTASGGDLGSQAFDEFVSRHEGSVWRYVRSLAPSTQTAEDALQECFLSAWRSAQSFRGEGNAKAWLLGIARNAVWKQMRRRVDEPDVLVPLDALGAEAGWGREASPDFDSLEARDAIEAGLEHLAPEEREVILLRDLQGLSNLEVAEMLEISLAAVKSRIHRARLQLMAELRPELEKDVSHGA